LPTFVQNMVLGLNWQSFVFTRVFTVSPIKSSHAAALLPLRRRVPAGKWHQCMHTSSEKRCHCKTKGNLFWFKIITH